MTRFKLIHEAMAVDIGDSVTKAVSKLILVSLCYFADEKKHASPSNIAIAHLCHLCTVTVAIHLKILEKNGWIIKRVKAGKKVNNLDYYKIFPNYPD